MTHETLPMTVEEVTPDWLLGALASTAGPGIRGAKLESAIHGTADKLIFALAHDAATSEGVLPTSVCVKGGFNKTTRALVADGYIAEARFFLEIAPHLESELPRSWYAAADSAARQGIVVLDDLNALGCRFGDPLVGLTVDEVAAGLEAQAAWHAASWNERGLERLTWLGHTSQLITDFKDACLSEDQWAVSLAAHSEAEWPTALRDLPRLRAAVRATDALNAKGPRVLAHGDAHVGNTFVTPDGSVGFLDWQTYSRGCWADDVAYFMVGALSEDARRTSEWELLDHYVDRLVSAGVPREDLADVREVYRRQHLHGLFWGLMPAGYQPADRCAAMCRRYASAMLEHDTLAVLGV